MPTVSDEILLKLLQALADRAPAPLYPARYAREQSLDREQLDASFDELRRRGLVQLTDWMKDLGQGIALTEAGTQALATKRVAAVQAPVQAEVERVDVTRSLYDRGEVVRRALIEPAPGYVARVMLAVNIAYFIFGAVYAGFKGLAVKEYLAGDGRGINEVLVDLGGLHPFLVLNLGDRPQFERLLLHAFLHVGFFHLLMNMFFLGTLAQSIEAMWGSVRFLVIYLIGGFVGGCVVLMNSMAQPNPPLTAGASGALYGIFVAMIVWFSLNHEHLPDSFLQDMSRSLMPNVILMVVINFTPGVSWQGHFGGAVGGLLTALLLHVQRFHPSFVVRVLALLAVPMVPLGFFIALLWQAGWLAIRV